MGYYHHCGFTPLWAAFAATILIVGVIGYAAYDIWKHTRN
jgi:hypothetical protein